MTHVAPARGAFALLGAALLIAGIYAAAVRGLADVNHTRARLLLAPPGTAPGRAPIEALPAAREALGEAARLDPANPLYVEMSAQMREQQALALPAGDPEARKLVGRALAESRSAALMLPGSAYVWANIAVLKTRLGEIDAEFYGALERAARLGPWEPQVQVAVIEVGLARWGRLPQASRAQVIDALERALLRQQAEVRRIAAAHGTLPLVCREPGLPPRTAALCVKK